MQINKSDINKILLIKPRGIGDIVLSTIVLQNLKEHFPSAEIHYLVEEFAKDSVENNPLVDKVITMRKSEFVLNVANRLRKEKYDILFDLYSNPRTAQITFLSGAKFKIGYGYKGRRYAYNIKVDSGRGNLHSAEHNLELLKALDIPITSKEISYYFSSEAKEKADSFFDKTVGEKTVVGIIPSGGWASKRCDKEKWIEIIKEVKNKFNSHFIILWGPGDEEDANYIHNNLPEITTLIPPSTVDELAAFISKCKMVIANDSGPMHIAAALNVPVLGLFGPTDPQKHGPYSGNSDYVIKSDLHCIICNKLVCPYNHECMTQLPVDEILTKTGKLLNEKA